LTIQAILFDYIGTLVEPNNYSMHESQLKLHRALCQEGLATDVGEFIEAYCKAHERHRLVRYQKLKEVTNAIWVAEALNSIHCKVNIDDARLKSALNVFFQDFINSLKVRPHAKQLLKTANMHCKVGLISNFTYAPAIYSSLRRHRIGCFFRAIIVSESVGWRKPHRIIFDAALRALQVKPEEAVFIGDSPLEDIDGAKKAGLRTIFVPSRFNTLRDVEESGVRSDMVFQDLAQICKRLPEIANST